MQSQQHGSASCASEPHSSDELSCPVCKQLFNDPCFACSNHHTLCRGCYDAIASAAGDAACCPQCNERLTDPVENVPIKRLVEAYRQASRNQQPICQARDGATKCERPAEQQCQHCSRYLCNGHLAKDLQEFMNNCNQLLSDANASSSQADTEQTAILKEWDTVLDNFKKLLDNRRAKVRQALMSSAPATALRAEAAALRAALAAGDLAAARVAAERLAQMRRVWEERASRQDQQLPDDALDRLNSRNFGDVADEIQKLCQSDPERQRRILRAAMRLRDKESRRCSVQ